MFTKLKESYPNCELNFVEDRVSSVLFFPISGSTHFDPLSCEIISGIARAMDAVFYILFLLVLVSSSVWVLIL
jgi:hypothetical protein